MEIRKATLDDFVELYKLGSSVPELKVTDEEFMSEADFKWHIKNPKGAFLLAEDNKKIVGFACMSLRERNEDTYACLVYLAVSPDYRRSHIASELYSKIEQKAKEMGAEYIYGRMDANSEPIQKFMKRQDYRFGQACIWVDKKLR